MGDPARHLEPVGGEDPLIADKPTASVIMVTPEIAARWLDRNTGNRKLKPQEIDRYARDMAAGNWKITGEAIKFAKSGRLLDGQNRLSAVIKADTTVPMFVMRGLDDEAQRVMDTGAKRTSADDLGMHGEKHASMLASAIRLAITAQEVGLDRIGSVSVSNSEVRAFLEANPDIRDAVQVARDVARQMDAYPAVVSYAYWVLSKIDRDEAIEFFTVAATKVGLQKGDPILAMTRRFAEMRRNRERLPHAAQLSVIFRAWNARREGKSLAFIRVKSPSKSGGDVGIPEPR